MAQASMISQDAPVVQQMTMAKAISPLRQDPTTVAGFDTAGGFELIQRMANAFSESTMVPEQYRGKVWNKKDNKWEANLAARSNCIIALDMATRMNANPLMIMQNLYIVEGRPSWSSLFIIASINACKKYSPLRFDMRELEERDVEYTVKEWADGQRCPRNITKKVHIKDKECIAWATERATGERLESPPISIGMAIAEGWYGKNGSKWQTMPEVMLRYRAASFFGKLYAPELLMGLSSAEEAEDTVYDLVQESPESGGHYTVSIADMSGGGKTSVSAEKQDTPTSKRRGRLPKEELEAIRNETLAVWNTTGLPVSRAEALVDRFHKDWTAANCEKVKQLAAEQLADKQEAVDVTTGEVSSSENRGKDDYLDTAPWGDDPGIDEHATFPAQSVALRVCPSTGQEVPLVMCETCRERKGCPAWEDVDGGAA